MIACTAKITNLPGPKVAGSDGESRPGRQSYRGRNSGTEKTDRQGKPDDMPEFGRPESGSDINHCNFIFAAIFA
jgi:hypothetical protein